MANTSRAKGTDYAQKVCDYLAAAGWPYAERRAQNGNQDRGDVAGIPGLVVEIKAEARYTPAAWLAEAEVERANDNADLGVVWAKRKGKAAAGDGYILMTPATLVRLLQAAGYGNQPTSDGV